MMDEKIIEGELNEVSGGAAYGAQYHTIQYGETLSSIAKKYGTTVNNLMALNPKIRDRNLIYAGDTIRVR